MRIVPVDRAADLAGVCSGYKTLALSLTISKLPGDRAGNTASLSSTCYKTNVSPPNSYVEVLTPSASDDCI